MGKYIQKFQNSVIMKLFLDDLRQVPDDTWSLVLTVDDCISLLDKDNITELSIDCDLSNTTNKTGYDVLKWLYEKRKSDIKLKLPKITVHTDSFADLMKMSAIIRNIERMV